MSRDLLYLLQTQVESERSDRERALHEQYAPENHELRVGFLRGLTWVLERIENLETEEDERRNNL